MAKHKTIIRYRYRYRPKDDSTSKTDDILIKLVEIDGGLKSLKESVDSNGTMASKVVSSNQKIVLALIGVIASQVAVKLVGSPPIVDAGVMVVAFLVVLIPGSFLLKFAWVKKG